MSGPNEPDEAFERLLRDADPADPEDRQLAAFVEDVRVAFPAAPLRSEEHHLAEIVATARLLAPEGGSAIDGSRDRATRARIRGRRRFDVRMPVFRSLTAKIVAGLAVLMWSLGGLAMAGAIPGGLGEVVSNTADGVSTTLSDDDVEDDADDVENDDADDVEDDADDVEDDADDDQGDDDEGEDDEGEDDEGEDDEGEDDEGEDDEGEDDEGEDDEGEDDEGEDDEGEDDEGEDDEGEDDEGEDDEGED